MGGGGGEEGEEGEGEVKGCERVFGQRYDTCTSKHGVTPFIIVKINIPGVMILECRRVG